MACMWMVRGAHLAEEVDPSTTMQERLSVCAWFSTAESKVKQLFLQIRMVNWQKLVGPVIGARF